MRVKSGWVPVTLVITVAFGLNGCSNSTKTSPSSSSSLASTMYVATQDNQKVTAYAIDRTNGSISSIGSPVASGAQASAMAISNDGGTVYVANSGDNSLSVYSINQDGSLTVSGSAVPAGNKPVALLVDPTGTLLFAADYGSSSIMVFATNGVIVTLKASFTVQAPLPSGGTGPIALAIAPASFPCIDNRTVTTPVTRNCYAIYAANQLSGTVTAYDYFVDASGNFVLGSVDVNDNFIVGGTVAGSPYSAGQGTSGIAFSRCAGITAASRGTACSAADGNNLFVTNSGSNNVTIFAACIQIATCYSGQLYADGTLAVVGSPIAAGTTPTTVLVDPSADFVYVVDSGSNQISEYQYSSVANGTLTPLGATAPTSSALLSAAITTNLNNTSSTHNWVLATSNGALSAFSVGSDGILNAGSSGQFTIQGQPSAIVVR